MRKINILNFSLFLLLVAMETVSTENYNNTSFQVQIHVFSKWEKFEDILRQGHFWWLVNQALSSVELVQLLPNGNQFSLIIFYYKFHHIIQTQSEYRYNKHGKSKWVGLQVLPTLVTVLPSCVTLNVH